MKRTNNNFLVASLKNKKATAQDPARKARNKYFREYRLRNPEKIHAIQARYWARKSRKKPEPKPQPYTLADLLGADAKNPDGSSKTFGQLCGREYIAYLEHLAKTDMRARIELIVIKEMLDKGEISL